jgi:hypothetical protein
MPADSTRKQFKCAKCGERTTIQLGAALAQNTTADDSEQVNELKTIRIMLGLIGAVFGLVLMAGSVYQLGGCSHSQSPPPDRVVPSNPLEPWRG